MKIKTLKGLTLSDSLSVTLSVTLSVLGVLARSEIACPQAWLRVNRHSNTFRFCSVWMAQVADFVRKTKDPMVDIPPAARIHLGRCDSPGAIRRASKRCTQALLDGKLDREVHNAAQYGLALMLKAGEAEREERERTAEAESEKQQREALPGGPTFNISFADGGPGCDAIETNQSDLDTVLRLADEGKLPASVAKAVRDAYGERVYSQVIYDNPDAIENARAAQAAANAPSTEANTLPETIAPPKPSPAVTAPSPKVDKSHGATFGQPYHSHDATSRTPPIAPAKRTKPLEGEVLPPRLETPEQAAEMALNRAVARDRIDRMRAEATKLQADIESGNERQRLELAERDRRLAEQEGKW